MADTPSLAEEVRALEEIVRRLEQEDVDLDAALKLFEEGIVRLRRARETLVGAEQTVQSVLADASGTLRSTRVDI